MTTARDLSVHSDASGSPSSTAVAVAGGILAGAGADADAHVDTSIQAYTGSGAINVTRDVDILAKSAAAATTDAVGVSAGGISVGVSLADATITPDIDAYIAGGSVTAGQKIRVRALHNFTENGTEVDQGASATATAPGGALLLSGNGADATAKAAADVASHVDSGATLSAGSNITVEALGKNKANAKATGITRTGAIVASVGAALADATTAGTVTSHVDGNVTNANNLSIRALSANSADADTTAVAGGIGVSVAGADSDAMVTPTITAYIAGGDIDVSNDVLVESISMASADADALGVAGAVGVAVGVSDAEAKITPNIDTYVAGATVTSTGGDIRLRSLHNFGSDGVTELGERADAFATAPGGALVSVNGAEATADASAVVRYLHDARFDPGCGR